MCGVHPQAAESRHFVLNAGYGKIFCIQEDAGFEGPMALPRVLDRMLRDVEGWF